MNRIEKALAELKDKNEKALITFVTAGDPDLETTEKLVLEMFDNGADIIEIGVPFSDPVAEGKVIQAASLRSLSNGTDLTKIFGTVENLRKKTDKPLILMMYVNTIFRFGTERFFKLCSEKGIDGVIVPDLPFEERDEIRSFAEDNGIIPISLVAPTSHQRIESIASDAHGFLYCVSSTGVTGTRSKFSTNFDEFFGEIKKSCKVPAMVGFGISGPEQAAKMGSYCDGVIVGSAIVKIIAEYGRKSVKKVGEFVRSLKDALR
ncbi:MAG: tryptophan synthase subunit alpha [Oscillospiraceae bacterium]|nr:tryptophan synthase subunit alpha [Oscillospiraceae bacterium]